MTREQRRLAAIVVADVVGFSRLMGENERDTLAALRALRHNIVEPRLAEYGGRLVKTTGDGLLMEFASVVEATRCAISIQRANDGSQAQLALRMGINLGDIVVEGDDILGDGVNVAARLEQIAEPGGICLSHGAFEGVRGKIDETFGDGGPQELKNIAQPVRVWRWPAIPAVLAPPLPNKPSIAVLPFQNISGDGAQDYFADGVVNDIITALARFPALFVIARHSSFTYRGLEMDVRQVGRELGVRYVLEGGVRRSGSKVRINAQLIDVESRAHLWAERYDGEIDDLFEFQDRIASNIAGALVPSLERAEISRVQRKPPQSFDAYDCYLRALALSYFDSREENDQAIALVEKSLAMAPDFVPSLVLMTNLWGSRRQAGWVSPEEGLARARTYVARARQIDKDDPDILALSARGRTLLAGQREEALALAERAVSLNPNSAACWLSSGWVQVYAGLFEMGIEHFQRALRLSPRDPRAFDIWSGLSFAHILAGQDAQAVDAARRAVQQNSAYVPARRFLAAALALSGELELARQQVRQCLLAEPDFSIGKLMARVGIGTSEAGRYIEGLRLAGVPE